MTYLTISDALNDGVKKILETLPEETAAAITYEEPFDVAMGFNALADICMEHLVGDSEKAAALKEAYKNESNTAANAVAKFMEAFAELCQLNQDAQG